MDVIRALVTDLRLLLVIFVLVLSFNVASQNPRERLIECSGFVMDEDSVPIPWAVVKVRGSTRSVITRDNGYYTLLLAMTDTIDCLALGFEVDSFAFHAAPVPKKLNVNFILRVDTGAVIYKKDKSPGSWNHFKTDFLDMEPDPGILSQNPLRPKPPKRIVFTGSGVAINGPITGIFKLIDRRERNRTRGLKKIKEWYGDEPPPKSPGLGWRYDTIEPLKTQWYIDNKKKK